MLKLLPGGLTHEIAITKMLRCLKEFRIRGVKTNIQFLENVLQNKHFVQGDYSTNFVDTTPELFVFRKLLTVVLDY